MTLSSTKEIHRKEYVLCHLRRAVGQQKRRNVRPTAAFPLLLRKQVTVATVTVTRHYTVSEASWIICLVVCEAKVDPLNYVHKFENFSIDRYGCDVICVSLKV